jgi:hypothetical protein
MCRAQARGTVSASRPPRAAPRTDRTTRHGGGDRGHVRDHATRPLRDDGADADPETAPPMPVGRTSETAPGPGLADDRRMVVPRSLMAALLRASMVPVTGG